MASANSAHQTEGVLGPSHSGFLEVVGVPCLLEAVGFSPVNCSHQHQKDPCILALMPDVDHQFQVFRPTSVDKMRIRTPSHHINIMKMHLSSSSWVENLLEELDYPGASGASE